MSEAGKAVFLSYASQDAEAAKKICEALRAAGVEVWFDQSELVGGDAWDQKIRKQIKECALLIPIISASTNARAEGYFRLEWRLADQRTHLMGRNKAFLLPVTIDGTTDAYADVPDSFVAVQWTKAPGGEVPAGFCTRVQKLLAGEVPSAKGKGETYHQEPITKNLNLAPPSWKAYAGLAVGALLIAAGATWFILKPKRSPEDIAKIAANVNALAAEGNRKAEAASPQQAELERVRARIVPDRWQKEDFETISSMLDRFIAANPDSSDAWALRSIINTLQVTRNYESGAGPLAAGRQAADRALRLAPASPFAELALGFHLNAMVTRGGDPYAGRPYLEQALPKLPRDPITRYIELVSAWQCYDLARTEQGAQAWLAAEPGANLPTWVMAQMNVVRRRPDEVEKWAERAVTDANVTGIRAYYTIFESKYYLRADLTAARAALDRVPAAGRLVHRVVHGRWLLAMAERRWDDALQGLALLTEPFLFDRTFHGPRALLAGQAHQRAGRPDAAAIQFREAERLLRERLSGDTENDELHAELAVTLACEGRAAEARSELALVEPLLAGRAPSIYRGPQTIPVAQARAILGDTERLNFWLRKLLAEPAGTPFTPASLRQDPRFSGLLEAPETQALLREFAHLDQATTVGAKSNVTDESAPPAEKSVAVLAFANLSDDKANEYFSDGISEELLNVLAKVPGLKVTARTSSFFFKGKEVPIPEIAKQLSVAYVVEGSVRKQGEKVRITAQLIKAADGFHVWSDTFTRDLKDVFAVQDEIAGLIAQQLQLKLGGSSRANQLVNPEAYDLYLRARALSRLEDENYLPIIKLFEAAVAKDPEFALAYVQLSLARASDYWAGGLDSKPAARAALQAAQRLAPDAPETRLAAGSYAYSCENDWNLARTEFLAAEAGLPGDAQVAFFLGMVQRRLLSFDESIRQVARAIELDPADRNNFAQQAHTFKALRRYSELVDLAGAALKRFPADENFLQTQAIARCEIDRDQAAYLRRLRELPAVEARARALKDYSLALNAGEWEAAGRILTGAQLDYLSITPATTRDPIAMQQAMLAHLQGRPELAQRFGAEALVFYQAQHGSLRQDKWMKLGQALALAYAGRGEEAIRLARETLAATALRDPWDTVILHTFAAQVYLVAGHRDDAFAELRIMMAGPCLQGAEELRRDPLWRSVKDDPRFEEILRSAKSL